MANERNSPERSWLGIIRNMMVIVVVGHSVSHTMDQTCAPHVNECSLVCEMTNYLPDPSPLVRLPPHRETIASFMPNFRNRVDRSAKRWRCMNLPTVSAEPRRLW
mgnify:CR=1 FL=1